MRVWIEVASSRYALLAMTTEALNRLEQHVPLAAERELDHALDRQIARRERHLFVGHGRVVDAQAARLDLPPRLAVRSDEAGFFRKRGEHADALVELGPGDLDRGQACGERSLLE